MPTINMPKTPNPKPQTPNPQPQTPNPTDALARTFLEARAARLKLRLQEADDAYVVHP